MTTFVKRGSTVKTHRRTPDLHRELGRTMVAKACHVFANIHIICVYTVCILYIYICVCVYIYIYDYSCPVLLVSRVLTSTRIHY